MGEIEQSKKKAPLSLYAGLVLIVMLVIGVAGQWWIGRPKRAAEHFISLLANDQFEDAQYMMVDADSLQVANNRDVTITARDKTTIILPSESRRLMAGGPNPSSTIGSFLGAPYEFEITAFVLDTETSQEYAVELHAVAIANRIAINSVD